ncbi:hypothetical protein Fmac_009792 [Flemingia macrophylla]|uniref:Uncharacterized protein n=1 Tax=Flemingia macrophylla TaxID=520843 RepID=A0ABD1N244_9FABA
MSPCTPAWRLSWIKSLWRKMCEGIKVCDPYIVLALLRFGHLVELYAWNPHSRYLDGTGPSGSGSLLDIDAFRAQSIILLNLQHQNLRENPDAVMAFFGMELIRLQSKTFSPIMHYKAVEHCCLSKNENKYLKSYDVATTCKNEDGS